MSTIQITLLQRLKGFVQPNISSESKGFFNEGAYELTDFKKDFPNNETDFAQIETPNEGKVWICVRWQDNSYAELKDYPQPQNGKNGNSSIDFTKN